jgi:hypothetical protein
MDVAVARAVLKGQLRPKPIASGRGGDGDSEVAGSGKEFGLKGLPHPFYDATSLGQGDGVGAGFVAHASTSWL